MDRRTDRQILTWWRPWEEEWKTSCSETDGRTATSVVTCLRGGMENLLFWDGRTDLHSDVLESRNGRRVVLRRTDSYLHGDVLERRNRRRVVLRRTDRQLLTWWCAWEEEWKTRCSETDGRTATYMMTCLRGGIEDALFWDGRTATYMVTCLRAGMENTLFWDGRTYVVTCLRAGMENTLFWDGRTDSYLHGDVLEERNRRRVVLRRTDGQLLT